MWLWLLAGWVVLSIAGAALHYRLRRAEPAVPPEVEEFLIRLQTALSARSDPVEFLGMMPGQFAALLRVRGQDTPVALSELYRRAQAFAEGFEGVVDRLVQEIEQAGLDQVTDYDFGMVATSILPQIRSRGWLEAQGRFGDSGLVHRMLNDDLVVVYVIDQGDCMVFLCQAHLRQWCKDATGLHGLSIANLERLGMAGLDHVRHLSDPILLQTGDGYDAARLLLLEEGADGLLVAVPDRDVLWVGQEKGQDLARLMMTAADLNRRAPHPVSPALYRMHRGRLEPVRP